MAKRQPTKPPKNRNPFTSVYWRNGAYHFYWRDPLTHRQRSKRIGSNLDEARAGRLEIENELAARGRFDQRHMTVSDLWDEFIEKRSFRLAPSTLSDYRSAYRVYIGPVLGLVQVAAVSEEHLEVLAETLASKVVFDAKKKPRPLSAKRQNNVLLVFKAMLAYAARKHLIGSNPGKDFESVPYHIERRSIPDGLQLERLIKRTPPHYQPLVEAAIFSGLRLGELAALEWDDLQLGEGYIGSRGSIRVNKTLSRGQVKDTTKTKAGMREVPIPPRLRKRLRELKAERDEACPNVFTNQYGGRLDPDNFRARVWRPTVKKVRLEGLHFHDLRHTYITRLVQGGADLLTVKRLAGHADISTTDHYFQMEQGPAQTLVNNIFDGPLWATTPEKKAGARKKAVSNTVSNSDSSSSAEPGSAESG